MLARAVDALVERHDTRGLICLVEAWRDAGDVPLRYRLAQVEALLDLCQPDRAWVRLKDLVEAEAPSVAALKLAGRMFIQRGWPQRALGPLERANSLDPDDDEVIELLAAAEEPAATLPDAPEGDALHELLPVAELLLSRGQQLKGQSVLERLRRAHPASERVADLLWALAADYSLGDAPLSAVVRELTHSSDDLPEDPEHTESAVHPALFERGGVNPDGSLHLDSGSDPDSGLDEDSADEASDFAFPALFRGIREGGEPDKRADTPISTARVFDDVTQSTHLADLDQLRDAVDAARRAAGFVGGEEFTEIRRVIRRPDGQAELREAVVGATIPEALFGGTTDRSTPRALGPGMDVDVEAEDDALIIVTKREDADAGLDMLDLDPNTEAVEHPDAARFLAEAHELEQRQAAEAEQARRRAERERAIADARRPVRRRTSFTWGWIAALVLLGGAALVLTAVVLVLYGVV